MIIKKCSTIIICLSLVLLCAAPLTRAQNMADYTAYPEFITEITTPNLLIIFDNSGSMYDLAYIDNGNLPLRDSSYCYDNTYSSIDAVGNKVTYAGYFEADSIYVYDLFDKRFEAGAWPALCSHKIPGELCVNILPGVPSTVGTFAARGNYLNWLTASKFDVQKQILTGGKYDTLNNEFIAESRGCVGRGFVKEALTANYVEGGVNTSLGVVFKISGPPNLYNPSGVSNGGQTRIEIYEGDYDEAKCQAAIEQINYASNPAAIRTTVEDCLSYDPQAGPGTQYCLLDPGRSCSVDSDCDNVAIAGDCSPGNPATRTCLSPASMAGKSCVNDVDCNTVSSTVGPCVGGTTHSVDVTAKIVFNQAMQECWQIWSGAFAKVGTDAWYAEAPKCSEIYKGFKICNGGDNDGSTCTSDAECPDGGTCINGPDAIRAGNSGLMCNTTYAGYCATTVDNWSTTNWVAQEFADPEECFLSKYLEFCNDVKLPPVTDPSDTPDDTSETANIPAIIADIGVEAQLGEPIAELAVKRYDKTLPTGLLHDYSDSIRFGAMKFNFNGSDSECNLGVADALSCPTVCSSDSSRVCTTDIDCPAGDTCVPAVGNKDAAKIIHYIGDGNCSVTTGTTCVRDDQCPDGETCVSGVGDHTSGLIKAINDEIKADSWTPFAEAYYNAIAYFVKDAKDNTTLNPAQYTPAANAIQEPLNNLFGSDFVGHKNPIEYSCQANNILIISDGATTADLNATMSAKVADASNLFNDGDASDPGSCGTYYGSTKLDDLSYFANHRNIFDPSDNDSTDDERAQRIKTYVVYTGSQTSTETGECAPKALMESTATNGGTTLFNPTDPADLRFSLERAFMEVSDDAASGSAVSVLATTSESDGAVYQAYFDPEQDEGGESRKWLGYVQSLFIDKYGNLREDTNTKHILDLKTDQIIEMGFDPAKGVEVYKCTDTNGDGKKESCAGPYYDLDVIQSLWNGGKELWNTDPAFRTIFTSLDGDTALNFEAVNAVALQPYLRAADAAESTNIINWTRGDDLPAVTDAGHPQGYRKRSLTIGGINKVWKLGDIIKSTPTVVGKPMENYDLLYGDGTYTSFRAAHRKRLQTVYVGANDGMLHAFNGGCFNDIEMKFYPNVDINGNCVAGTYTLGQEFWSYIPRGLLSHLKWNTQPDYTHVYYVDNKPKITDIQIFDDDPDHVKGWGTILIGGFGLGGKDMSWTSGGKNYTSTPEYFALDITNPIKPRVLWTFSHPDLGLSMSYPSISRIGNKWYAIFGSGAHGYDIDSNLTNLKDGYVFVLDLSSSKAGDNGVIRTADWIKNTNYWMIPTFNTQTFLSDAISVDVNRDFDTDVMYIGENLDLGGGTRNAIMHRITTSKGTTGPASWDLSSLANINSIAGAADVAKRITAAPSAAMDKRANLWLFFGTGQFIGRLDKNQTDTGGFYAIKDGCWKGTCNTSYTGLLDISSSTVETDGSVGGLGGTDTWGKLMTASQTADGWAMYFGKVAEAVDYTGALLSHQGERMLSKPLVLGGLVSWTTYIPGIDECSSKGESNVYAVYYTTGTAYKDYVFTDQKDQANPDTKVARVKKLGAGMPSSMSAQITSSGTTKGFAQQSTGSILEIESVNPVSMQSGVLGWRSELIP